MSAFYLPPNQELPLPLLPENMSFQLERPEPPEAEGEVDV
jgi:hypothetical protein